MEPLTLKRTGAADFPRHIKALVMGPPKTGKTHFAATFPNPLFADIQGDAGLMTIAHKDLPYVDIESTSALKTLLMVLGDDTMRGMAADKLGVDTIDTLVLDTVDALQEMAKREILASSKRTQMEQKDWGQLLEQLQNILRAAVALDMHVVLTCHTKTTQDDEQRIYTAPGLQGAIAEQIAGYVGFSMMTQKTREIDRATGQAFTSYTLKTEGDERNPHLGNRSAGRLKGVIEPEFKVLHDAVYAGAPTLNATTEATLDDSSVPAARARLLDDPTGQGQGTPPPAPDDDQPATDAALTSVAKMLTSWGFAMPDSSGWTLGFARSIARMHVALNSDVEHGRDTRDSARFTFRQFLEGIGAWVDPDTVAPDGTVEQVLAWVGEDAGKARIALDQEVAGKARKSLLEPLRARLGEPKPEPEPQPKGEPEELQSRLRRSPEEVAAGPAPQTLVEAVEQADAEEAAEVVPVPQAEPISERGPEMAGDWADAQTAVETAEPEPAAWPDRATAETDAAVSQLSTQLGAVPVDQPAPEQEPDPVAALPKVLTPEDAMKHRATLLHLTRDQIDAAPLCQATGEPIDDLDIAQLALTREGKWLSVRAYIDLKRNPA
jgi:AAA domain